MSTKHVFVALTVVGALILPTAASAEVILGDRIYPEHLRSQLIGACQGLEGKSRESLTERESFKESGDPASDWRLRDVTFSLRDCREAGLI
jgi:hypothetical protein